MVCFEIDDFIQDKDEPHWFVDLSDGTRVFGDDNRPGLSQPIAWLRLRDYLYENKLSIAKLWVRFRSNSQLVGSSDYGYMYRKGLMANIADGTNHARFIFGLINKDNKIEVHTWQVPELQKVDFEYEERDIEGHEESIIWNSQTLPGILVPHNITSLS